MPKVKVTRLEVLKNELEIVKHLDCLSYDLIDEVCNYYEKEIRCIEEFHSPNPVYEMEE